jgi:hypothetical protein
MEGAMTMVQDPPDALTRLALERDQWRLAICEKMSSYSPEKLIQAQLLVARLGLQISELFKPSEARIDHGDRANISRTARFNMSDGTSLGYSRSGKLATVGRWCPFLPNYSGRPLGVMRGRPTRTSRRVIRQRNTAGRRTATRTGSRGDPDLAGADPPPGRAASLEAGR